MCVVSMVGDFYRDTWETRPWFPQVVPTLPFTPTTAPAAPITITPAVSHPAPSTDHTVNFVLVSRQEFDDLKRQVMEMKELLQRAKRYDERNNEPDCEIDEKMDLLRRVAAAVGVDLDDVLSRRSAE